MLAAARAPGFVSWSAALLLAGCADPVADPRPQLVVVVDTDAIVQGLIVDHPELAADAAIDTVRIDAIASDGSATAYDLRTFIAPSPEDWPLSFGVESTEASFEGPVRLRIRAFSGRLARSGVLAGAATLDPPATVTIDRLIEVEPPREGVHTVKVVLRADCLGVPTFFTDPPTTCVDALTTRGEPAAGVERVVATGPLATEVGTWARALEAPCTGSPPAEVDAVCIPGGFAVLGHEAVVGLDEVFIDAAPLRPVALSPFYFDRTEVTVGAFRAAVVAGWQPASEPCTRGDEACDGHAPDHCTWRGADDAGGDALPLNCLAFQTALDFCEARGGALPTEAQWEHAARGRGRGTLYPWGDEAPTCCTASVSRGGASLLGNECPGEGVEPVGSHPRSAACAGLGDVSRDGVLDLAGSLEEMVQDAPQRYDAACWSPPNGGGILSDPVCVQGSLDRSARGGSWNSGTATTASVLRGPFGRGPYAGFRCAYTGVAP